MLHGTSDLGLAYTLVLAGMLVALYAERASLARCLLAPLVAAGVAVLAALVVALLFLPERLLARLMGVLQILFHAAIVLAAGFVAGRQLARARLGQIDALYQRGAILLGADQAQNPSLPDLLRRLAGVEPAEEPPAPGDITLARVPIPLDDETKHFKLIGTTGTGKTTAIRELLTAALARGDRVIIADPDGGYLNRFYDASRGDVILNPFLTEAVHRWDLFGEIDREEDVANLTRALIPDGGRRDPEWPGFARTYFTAIIRHCLRKGVTDIRAMYGMVTEASPADLRQMLGGAAFAFLAEGNEKMFGSVRSTAGSALETLEYIGRQQGQPLSVRQWVRDPSRGGVLFFPYQAVQITAVRSLISAWMRLGIFEAMSQPEGDQRLWFVVDELDALGAIDGLKDALARLRKFGGRCVLGFQSIDQVSSTYGEGDAHTIVENAANTLILRCSASKHGGTAEFASRLIGEREVLRTMQSWSRRPGDWLASLSRSQQRHLELAVLPSEIEQLPNLTGFLKRASRPEWRHVRLVPGSDPGASPSPFARPRPPVGSPPARPPVSGEPTPGDPRQTQPGSAPAALHGRGAQHGRPSAAPPADSQSRPDPRFRPKA